MGIARTFGRAPVPSSKGESVRERFLVFLCGQAPSLSTAGLWTSHLSLPNPHYLRFFRIKRPRVTHTGGARMTSEVLRPGTEAHRDLRPLKMRFLGPTSAGFDSFESWAGLKNVYFLKRSPGSTAQACFRTVPSNVIQSRWVNILF